VAASALRAKAAGTSGAGAAFGAAADVPGLAEALRAADGPDVTDRADVGFLFFFFACAMYAFLAGHLQSDDGNGTTTRGRTGDSSSSPG
jgi:hypothetical protein